MKPSRRSRVPRVRRKAPADANIDLDARLSIREAAGMAARFDAALSGARALTVNCASLVEIDTAGLQLLLVARKTAERRNAGWHWLSPSQVLIDSAYLLGLSAALGLPGTVKQ